MKIAAEAGLGNRINMVMQAVFFNLAKDHTCGEALGYLKKHIEKMYGKKGRGHRPKDNDAEDHAHCGRTKLRFLHPGRMRRKKSRKRRTSLIL
jgi:pyruvate-ferredoxin/flavodoxin oxidoreductase